MDNVFTVFVIGSEGNAKSGEYVAEKRPRVGEGLPRLLQAVVLLLPRPAGCNLVKLVADVLQQLGEIALPLVELQLLLVQNLLGNLFPNHSASSSMSKVHIIEMADKCLRVLLRQLFQKGSVGSARRRWFWNCVALFLEPLQVLLECL